VKPLTAATLTSEDERIWDRIRRRMVFVDRMLVPHPLSWRSFTSDRRDADMMLEWRKLRGIVGATFSASSVCGPCFGRLG